MSGAFANWAQALTSDQAFKSEQQRLGRYWTLLGHTHDVANDGDWFRATLGGRSVFVQRFGDAIKAFENRCAHRFYPLRNADKGNGPVVCGFHHWRYDSEGRAVGIPMCPEVFGATPRELNARLTPVEIATCGALIFGRFADDGAAQTLEHYLGDGFPILKAMCSMPERPNPHGAEVEANWKLCVQITLDDYHIVAVHHRPGYHVNAELNYFRFGPHSAEIVGGSDTLASMAEDCRNGRYRPVGYRIFSIFPNLAVSMFRAQPYWYFHVQQFVPLAPGRCNWRGWFGRTEFLAEEEKPFDRWMRPYSEPIRARIVRHYVSRTNREDRNACEQLQTTARQIGGWPMLSTQEKRIAWFEEAYADAVA